MKKTKQNYDKGQNRVVLLDQLRGSWLMTSTYKNFFNILNKEQQNSSCEYLPITTLITSSICEVHWQNIPTRGHPSNSNHFSDSRSFFAMLVVHLLVRCTNFQPLRNKLFRKIYQIISYKFSIKGYQKEAKKLCL